MEIFLSLVTWNDYIVKLYFAIIQQIKLNNVICINVHNRIETHIFISAVQLTGVESVIYEWK